MTIYERIRALRQSMNMSQEDLAHKMGYKDRSMIAKIEGGKVDISQKKIHQFAEALDTSPGYLMGWTEEIEKTYSEVLKADELLLVEGYRTLSDHGKNYLHEQLTIATHMYGEKSESDSSQQSV